MQITGPATAVKSTLNSKDPQQSESLEVKINSIDDYLGQSLLSLRIGRHPFKRAFSVLRIRRHQNGPYCYNDGKYTLFFDLT